MRSWYKYIKIFLILVLVPGMALYAKEKEKFWGMIPGPYKKNVNVIGEKNGIVYVGTWGGGIFRSPDSNDKYEAWSERNNGLDDLYITDLYCVLQDKIYAATYNSGIYYYEEGNPWIPSGLAAEKVKAITHADSLGGDILLAGTYGRGVFISNDHAKNWYEINNGLLFRDINDLAISAGPQDTVFLAATNGGGVFRSFDRGKSWEKANKGIPTGVITRLVVDAGGEIFAGTFDSGVYHSTDYGSNWLPLGNMPLLVNSLALLKGRINDLLFAATNNNGLFKYNIDNNSWFKINNDNLDGGVTDIKKVSREDLLASLPYKGLYWSNDEGSSWSPKPSTEAFRDNMGIRKIFTFDSLVVSADSNLLHISANFGNSWLESRTLERNITCFAADSLNRLYVGTDDSIIYRIFFNKDSREISSIETLAQLPAAYVTSISIRNGTEILAGLKNESSPLTDMPVLVSYDENGKKWNTLYENSSDVTLTGVNYNGDIYICLNYRQMLRSVTGGEKWSHLDTNLYINSLDFSLNNYIYVATNSGIFRSINNGGDWKQLYPKRSTDIAVTIAGNLYCVIPEDTLIIRATGLNLQWDTVSAGFVKTRIESFALNLKYGYLYLGTSSLYRTIAPEYLAAPKLILPDDNSNNIPRYFEFRWSGVSRADLYVIQYATDPAFENIIEEGVIADSKWVSNYPFVYNQVYYWRVRAKTNASYSGWAGPYKFTSSSEGPILKYPADNAFGIPVGIVFRWNKYNPKSAYEIQVSTDSIFDEREIILDKQTGIESFPASNLSFNTRYYWRVKATNSNWSVIWTFRTMMETPVLISPENGNYSFDNTVMLNWYPVAGAFSYKLEVSKNYDFSDPEQFTTNGTEYQYDVSQKNIKYYWRVMAANGGDDTSAFSDQFMFNTKPERPVPVQPYDNDVYILPRVTFTWDAPKSASRYELQISEGDDDFSQGFLSFDLKDNFLKDKILKNNTLYYWRVRFFNDIGISSLWSDTSSFWTGIPTVLALSPADKQDKLDTSVEFTWEEIIGTGYSLQISTDESFTKDSIVREAAADGNSITVSGLKFGQKYYWHVRAEFENFRGGWSETRSFTTRQESTFTEDFTEKYGFSIMPNPFSDGITIEYNIRNAATAGFEIIDISGREIIDINQGLISGSGRFYQDLSDLFSGLYFLKVKFGKDIAVFKIIKRD